ncbi:MAG: CvpA family protein [Bacteroidales bacterium]|nr:CvpA family protein [Bacteroidales bacterium]
MVITDIILLCCFIPGVVRGITKGFVGQAVAFISVVLGVWLASRFSAPLSLWAAQWVEWKPELLRVAVFAIILVLTITVLYIIGHLFTKLIKKTTLGWLNRLLGVILGFFITCIILSVVVTAFDAFNSHWQLVKPEYLDESSLWKAMRAFANGFFPYVKQLIVTGHV